MRTPPRPSNPLEYTAAERSALLGLVVACGLLVAAVHYWPVSPPAEASPEARAAYAAEVEAFVARSRARTDSLRAAAADRERAREEREAAWAERRATWAERRATWARERAERTARYASLDHARGAWGQAGSERGRRPPAATVAIDYAVPLPALGSLGLNTVDSATLLRLGTPVAVVARWLKYRRAGGRLRAPADVAKLYGLADTTAARLQTFFVPESPESSASGPVAAGPQAASARDRVRPVDLNVATAEELAALPGVGAYTAGEIVEYRAWLGGYVDVAQVAEVRGVRPDNYEALRPYLLVGDDARPARRIDVNAAAGYDEWRHPYLPWKKAKVLAAYRERHGPYARAEDLLHARVLSPEELARLAPYLDFGG